MRETGKIREYEYEIRKKFSFLDRISDVWDDLPTEILRAKSIHGFKGIKVHKDTRQHELN